MLAPSTAIDDRDEPAFDDRVRWDEAVAWAKSEESGSVLEVDSPVRSEWFKELPPELQLRGAIFHRGGINAEAIDILASRFDLEFLVVKESRWTSAELKQLVAFPALQRLNIDGLSNGPLCLEPLFKLPQLTSLRVGGEGLSSDSLAGIDHATRLTHLHLLGFEVGDGPSQKIKELPQLTSLYLDDCQFAETWLAEIVSEKPDLHLHVNGGHFD